MTWADMLIAAYMAKSRMHHGFLLSFEYILEQKTVRTQGEILLHKGTCFFACLLIRYVSMAKLVLYHVFL